MTELEKLGSACDGLEVEGLDDEPSDSRSIADVVDGPAAFDISTNCNKYRVLFYDSFPKGKDRKEPTLFRASG